MASVTIRNLDDDVVAALKQRAKANSRSLEAELRVVLIRAVRGEQHFDRAREGERIRAVTPKDRPPTDSVELLREDRRR